LTEHPTILEFTSPAPLETEPDRLEGPQRTGLSLFWRTFLLLTLLLLGSIVAWLQALRTMEIEPHAIQTAKQIASLVNLSRAALVHSDAIARVSLIKTITQQENVRILPREPGDVFEPFGVDALSRRIAQELSTRLGPGTIAANSVNHAPGLWVGFVIDGDNYWMQTDRSRFDQTEGKTWLVWLLTAAALSLAGAAVMTRLINRPLKQLSFAASRVREGDFGASQLDEEVATSEIRQVNIGFNRMAQRLSKVEQDRAVMLAGISHDLRTPLARLRLETEMSVADPDARAHMAADIEQLDAIIDKFLDYARPDHVKLVPVSLNKVVQSSAFAFKERANMHVSLDLEDGLWVMADEVELGRVISNLLENARRYGKSLETGLTEVKITARAREETVLMKVRDRGQGVAPEHLPNLTKPFFRGDSARTAATGAGLGLSIVDKTIVRMGGQFALSNTSSGGLAAHIKLIKAKKVK
jgi:two-component system osmolarity sensor histidine kinase EnvZ